MLLALRRFTHRAPSDGRGRFRPLHNDVMRLVLRFVSNRPFATALLESSRSMQEWHWSLNPRVRVLSGDIPPLPVRDDPAPSLFRRQDRSAEDPPHHRIFKKYMRDASPSDRPADAGRLQKFRAFWALCEQCEAMKLDDKAFLHLAVLVVICSGFGRFGMEDVLDGVARASRTSDKEDRSWLVVHLQLRHAMMEGVKDALRAVESPEALEVWHRRKLQGAKNFIDYIESRIHSSWIGGGRCEPLEAMYAECKKAGGKNWKDPAVVLQWASGAVDGAQIDAEVPPPHSDRVPGVLIPRPIDPDEPQHVEYEHVDTVTGAVSRQQWTHTGAQPHRHDFHFTNSDGSVTTHTVHFNDPLARMLQPDEPDDVTIHLGAPAERNPDEPDEPDEPDLS